MDENTKIDVNKHPVLSEDFLLDNLPEGWTYDCCMGEVWGFTITATDGKTLFIPLRLLGVPDANS